MYKIEFTPSALEDIKWFSKRDQVIIFATIQQQLTHEPNVETRHRKRLQPNPVAKWELRVNDARALYDVDEAATVVEIKIVARKERDRLWLRNKEFKL
jgi:mRNA-degrading endonuclease RelE of RelBE toxin-antitoxin system